MTSRGYFTGATKAEISYTYRVNGVVWTGNTLEFLGRVGVHSAASGPEDSEKYPTGRKVDVFYQKETPQLSVLEPGITTEKAVKATITTLVFLFVFAFSTYLFLCSYFYFQSFLGLSQKQVSSPLRQKKRIRKKR